MRRFHVEYTRTAQADLISIGERISEARGEVGAEGFIGRMIAVAESLEHFPRRHRVRRKLGLG